jgi:predicted TIM-barrel fold metal-dependent hydrolase
MSELFRSANSPGGGFSSFRAPTVMACQQLLMSEVPQLFPRLRWGFIEAAANWVPWVVSDVKERYQIAGRPIPEYPLEANRIYVTCQTTDDLPFVLKHAGENSILIGTDYGHTDASSELDAITVLRQESGLPEPILKKILDDNPRALYAL